jgi:predicted RNase H-like HicB family nuclease
MAIYVGILDGHGKTWGVRIPDLPGCYGAGATGEAAITDAASAAREWIAHQLGNGGKVSEPRSVAKVLKDPSSEFNAAGGEAAVMIHVLIDKSRSVRANISLDAGLLEAIDEAAEMRGLTRSAFLASAAMDKIAEAK